MVLIVALVALAMTLLVWRRQGPSPLSAGLLIWVVVLALSLLAPIELRAVTSPAAVVIAIGIVGLSLGALLVRNSRARSPAPGKNSVQLARLAISVAVALAMVAVGVVAFRTGVASATGQDFAQLSAQDVRAAQTGAAQGGGLAALLAAANPLLACLGVYGWMRYSRWWGLAIVVGLLASLQTPARLTTLSLMVQCLVIFLYARRGVAAESSSHSPSMASSKALGIVTLVGGAMIFLFVFLGDRVGKNDFAKSFFPEYSWPDWSLNPVLYFIGGPSALSYALDANADPAEQGGSIYTIARFWVALDDSYQAPDALADFVPIPIPFNVYTGFGQIYFDFGLGGVLGLTFLLGWLASLAHKRALTGSLGAVWLSSAVVAILLSLPQAYRLFYLDVTFQLLTGALIFAWIGSATTEERFASGRHST